MTLFYLMWLGSVVPFKDSCTDFRRSTIRPVSLLVVRVAQGYIYISFRAGFIHI